MITKIVSSESVTEGHPDKFADAISDAVLDAYIEQDPSSRVAAETLVKGNLAVLAGEISSTVDIDVVSIVKKVAKNIGYKKDFGFDVDGAQIIVNYDKQSPDIARGVDNGKDQGAGDQGMVYGYATNETDAFMPTPIYYAHKLTKQLTDVRKQGKTTLFGPDGKAQVSVEYDENGKPVHFSSVVVSIQQTEEATLNDIRKEVHDKVFSILPKELFDDLTNVYINPTGRFVVGGPLADSGLTGRKIIVDTYGGVGRHGGGAFSGKDPSKVDRSGAYYARYVAKNIVAAGLAERCEIQVSYAIGVAQPVSVYVDTFGTSKYSDTAIQKAVRKTFDFRPRAIIEDLDLLRPIYSQTTNYGHFGKPGMAWEKTDMVRHLLKNL